MNYNTLGRHVLLNLWVCFSVEPSAIGPDFAGGSGQRVKISHSNHGLSEGGEELALAAGEAVDDTDGGSPGGGEQNLVASQQATVVLEICEVVAVERVRSGGVQIHERVSSGLATLPELICVRRVQGRVRA